MQEKAFVMLLFYFGLQRGECPALTKADIVLKKKTLAVNKTVVFDKNIPTIKDGAKSDAGNRTLPIPESAESFFKRLFCGQLIVFTFLKKKRLKRCLKRSM